MRRSLPLPLSQKRCRPRIVEQASSLLEERVPGGFGVPVGTFSAGLLGRRRLPGVARSGLPGRVGLGSPRVPTGAVVIPDVALNAGLLGRRRLPSVARAAWSTEGAGRAMTALLGRAAAYLRTGAWDPGRLGSAIATLDILRGGVSGRCGFGEKNVEDGTSVPTRWARLGMGRRSQRAFGGGLLFRPRARARARARRGTKRAAL